MSMGHLSPDETDKILFLRLHPQDANLQNYINCSAIEYVGLIVQSIIVRCGDLTVKRKVSLVRATLQSPTSRSLKYQSGWVKSTFRFSLQYRSFNDWSSYKCFFLQQIVLCLISNFVQIHFHCFQINLIYNINVASNLFSLPLNSSTSSTLKLLLLKAISSSLITHIC